MDDQPVKLAAAIDGLAAQGGVAGAPSSGK
jgi:hypothetical protein